MPQLKRVPCAVAAAAILAFAASRHTARLAASHSETAEWVARQADQRDVGKDGSFQLKMRLFDRQQRVRDRELTITTLC